MIQEMFNWAIANNKTAGWVADWLIMEGLSVQSCYETIATKAMKYGVMVDLDIKHHVIQAQEYWTKQYNEAEQRVSELLDIGQAMNKEEIEEFCKVLPLKTKASKYINAIAHSKYYVHQEEDFDDTWMDEQWVNQQKATGRIY